MSSCGTCGAALQEGARFCPGCGSGVAPAAAAVVEAAPHVCTACGFSLPPESTFCPMCGAKAAPPMAAAAPPPAYAPGAAPWEQAAAAVPTPPPWQAAPPAMEAPQPPAPMTASWQPVPGAPAAPYAPDASPPPQPAGYGPPPAYQQPAPYQQPTPYQQPAPSYAQPTAAYPQPAPPYQQPTAAPVYPAQYPAPEAASATTACLACGNALRPGARFCRSCGTPADTFTTPVAPARAGRRAAPAAPAGKAALDPRGLVIAGALAVAFFSVFLDWISVSAQGFTLSVGPFTEDARFRLSDWLDTSSPVDGMALLLVSGLGLAAFAARTFALGSAGLRTLAGAVLSLAGPVLSALFVAEAQYIVSQPGIGPGDFALGMYALGAAAAAVTIARFLPQQRGQ